MTIQYRTVPAEMTMLGEREVMIRMTTSERARDGHILPPEACILDNYRKNPIQLWRHDSGEPIGTNSEIKVDQTGINAKTTFAPPGISLTADKICGLVKSGVIRSVSIGFDILEAEPIDPKRPYDGLRASKWELYECSFVSVPSDTGATVIARDAPLDDLSLDAEFLAASGRKDLVLERPKPPAGVSATKSITVVRAQEGKHMPMTIAEQIASFTSTLATKSERLAAIMAGAGERGETLTAEETEEYDTCRAEKKSVEEHLARLRDHERENVSRATDVTAVTDVASGSRARETVHATVRTAPKVEKGIGFTRYCMAVARSKGNLMQAERMVQANEQWMVETPDVLHVIRSAVNAGTTTDTAWASPLVQYQNLANDFIEYLRPLTLLGKIQGLRRVPFKVKIPRQTGTSTAGWVGEGQAKPVSALSFDSVTLDITTISDIVVFTQQLAMLSQPSVEMLVRDDLAKKIINFMDAQFIDPTVSASGTTSPASVTNGVSPTVASGTTADALRTDVGTLFEGFLEANMQLNDACWVMSQVTAARINLIRSNLGVKEYPEINVNGGFFEGLPVYVSQSVPATGGSPTDGYPIILMNAGDILIADDGQIRIDASSEASVQMDSAPDSPTTGSTTLISFWQQGYTGIKADRDVNWVKRRSTAVSFISNAKYTTD